MKTRIRSQVSGSNARDLGRLAKSAKFVGLTDDSDVETDIDTEMAAAIPSASIDDLVEMSEGLKELRSGNADMGQVSSTDNLTEGGNKFLNATSVQPALSVSGDLSYDSGVVSYTAPTASALQVVATVGDLPAGASAGDQAVVQSNNKLYIKTADGWYAVALINTAPTVSGNDAAYTLATDQTPTVITLTATDPENDPVTFSHSVTSGDLNGTTVTQNDNVFTITPHGVFPATFELTFSANDSVNVATAVSSFSLVFSVPMNFSNSISNRVDIQSPITEASSNFGFGVIANGTKFLASIPQGSTKYTSLWDISNPNSPSMLWNKANGDSSHNGGIGGADTTNYNWIWNVCEYNMSDTYYAISHSYENVSGRQNFVKVYNLSSGNLVRQFSPSDFPHGGSVPVGKMEVGSKLAIDGDTIYIPTPNSQNSSGTNIGHSVFVYSISTGNLIGTIDYPGGFTDFTYGHRNWGANIAVGSSVVAVQSWGDAADGLQRSPSNVKSGRVYLFDKTTLNNIAAINNPNPTSYADEFGGYKNAGSGMSISGNYLAIGNPKLDAARGALYIYDISTPTSPSLLYTVDSSVYTSAQGGTELGDHMSSQGDYVMVRDQMRGGFIIVNMSDGTIEQDLTGITGSGWFLTASLAENSVIVGERETTYNGRSGKVSVLPAV